MERKLASLVNQDYTIAGGVDAIVEILNTVDRGTEKHIMETLEIDEPELAEEIRRKMFEVMEKYGIKEVVAHNAHFDYTVLNNIVKYLSGSRVRNWFPFGMVEWWDSLNMAKSVMLKMPTYEKFCIEELGLPKANAKAETLYRFIIKDPDFIESHTALEDVLIESQIVAYCYRQHKEMRKKLFTKELPEMTPFQLAVFMGVRNNPMI
jgi:DNA polymerase III epsilon subunit-like protein